MYIFSPLSLVCSLLTAKSSLKLSGFNSFIFSNSCKFHKVKLNLRRLSNWFLTRKMRMDKFFYLFV
ncbi:hypothetical protein Hanom_Chr15g01370551 [Helianthus anomalus]